MIVVGSIIVLAIFLAVGWAVTVEMLQHRHWRRRVREGDTPIVAALIEEALNTWRAARPPRGTPSHIWAGIQGAQLLAVTIDSATLSASAEPEFRTEAGQRVQVTSSLDEARALASRLLDMMLYDVPNLRLGSVRVDVYSTFTEADGAPVQQPILTSTAHRDVADAMEWEALTPAEILARFETHFETSASNQALPITLPPIEGESPIQNPESKIQNV